MPQWALDYMSHWKDELHLSGWTIIPALSPRPGGDVGNAGYCVAQPDIVRATLTFRDDITKEPHPDWEMTIIHEMVHVSMAGVDNMTRNIITPELGSAAQRLADKAYKAAVEPFVENMAIVLWRLHQDGLSNE